MLHNWERQSATIALLDSNKATDRFKAIWRLWHCASSRRHWWKCLLPSHVVAHSLLFLHSSLYLWEAVAHADNYHRSLATDWVTASRANAGLSAFAVLGQDIRRQAENCCYCVSLEMLYMSVHCTICPSPWGFHAWFVCVCLLSL